MVYMNSGHIKKSPGQQTQVGDLPHFNPNATSSCPFHIAIAADREIALVTMRGVATMAGVA